VPRSLGTLLLAALSLFSVVATRWENRVSGLRLTVHARPSAAPPETLELLATDVTSDVLLLDPRVPSSARSARWEGLWQVETDGPCHFLLRGREPARVWVDGSLIFQHDGAAPYKDERAILLSHGLHPLRADFEIDGPLPVFKLFLTPPGRGRPSEGGRDFFPAVPSQTTTRLLPAARLLRGATCAAWVLAFLWGVRLLRPHARAPLLAALVVLYAGGLRLEAVVRGYWGLDAPGWARRVTAFVGPLRPVALKPLPIDRPYPGDPGAYLRFAREMERFYDAHVREPLFPAVTRIGLAASGGADVGISLTSAAFSTLMVWGTYLLGSLCFNRRVALLAALLLAIEPVAILLGADGWRDEAFSFFVLLSTWSLVRLRGHPSFANALGAGLAGGAVCLTRMTALSFLLPASLFVYFGGDPTSRRQKLRAMGLSVLITGLLVAPYLATSAIVFGDPFVSINAHTQFYRTRADLSWSPSMTWLQYLTATFRPAELIRNMLIGLTTYPFDNKWDAYDVWLRHSAIVLRLLSVAGLFLFLRHREGRLLLLVLVAALLPFAFTWRVPGGSEWRFTLHAYPFYLLAAAHAIDRGLTWLRLPNGRISLT
jgi:hypothetical protein